MAIQSSPFDPVVRNFVIQSDQWVGPFRIIPQGSKDPVAVVSWEEEKDLMRKFGLEGRNMAIAELQFRAWLWAMGVSKEGGGE